MESRKRKEAPESAGEDVSEPPTKTVREVETAKAEESTDAQADPVAVTTATDAAALPKADEPAAENGNPPNTPGDEGTPELNATPKVLPKPSSPEELAHWNQMFFDLMVR